MKRLPIVTVITLAAVLAFTSIAFAAGGPPSMDAWTDASTTSYNTTTFVLQASYNGGAATCDVVSTGYMQWDLSTMSGAAGYADLAMTLTGTTAAGSATTVTLYSVSNDNWTEANVGTVKPALGTALSSVTLSASTTYPSVLTFQTSPAFVDFINSQASVATPSADNKASFGIRISACGTSATVRFATREDAAQAEQLHLKKGPNAVEMSSASAQQAAWPLYAGLAAVVLLVVAGVTVSRRRTA